MMQKQAYKWWLDALLLTGFLTAFYVSQTGLSFHQWIGVGCGAAAVYHFFLHWRWVRAVVGNMRNPSGRASRKYLLVNGLLLFGFLAIVGTGLAMATWFDLELREYSVWRVVHIAASISTLIVALVKLYLHWRWVAQGFKKAILQPLAQLSVPAVPKQAASGAGAVSRKEFLMLLGVLGPVSLFTLGKSLDTLLVVMEVKGANSDACVVRRCWSQCHFPGKCGGYTDKNHNKQCDMGECLRTQ